MGSLADLAALRTAQASPSQTLDFVKDALLAVTPPGGGGYSSTWSRNGVPANGGTPGATSAACDRTTTGALGQTNASAGQLYAWIRRVCALLDPAAAGSNTDTVAKLVIADRLAHIGGMNGTLTTPQLTLGMGITRNTNGAGVLAALEIYTTVGTTGTTVTASYTNQAGTAGQTTQPIVFGGTGYRTASRFLPLSLTAGDTGVRDVASATVLASTGTAGNFGVTIYRPLLTLPLVSGAAFPLDGDPVKHPGLPVILDNACLFAILYGSTGVQSAVGFSAEIEMFEA